jgi:4-aminobutyrate aminotransferase-like enzyme
VIEAGLIELKRHPFVANVRGERGGMVWGVEMRDHAGTPATQWANDFVLAAYLADGRDGVHLLGPLSKKVIRIAPPLVITPAEARAALAILDRAAATLAGKAP